MAAVSEFIAPTNPLKDTAIPLVLAVAIAIAGIVDWNDGLSPLGVNDTSQSPANTHMRKVK